MSFANQVVVITGGASGMGGASAKLFSEAGASVAIVDLNGDLARETAGSLKNTTAYVGDVSDSRFCQQVIDEVVAAHGRLDVLVNAAGIILRADALDTTDDGWQRVMNVNVNGVFYMSRAAVRPMLDQKRGVIINFGSIWGEVGATNVVAYCASKGAVHQITRAMALDYVEQGIRINAVCPGEVDTPMLRSGRDTPPTEADMQRLAESVPMKRLADPAEIAHVVKFLASDEASYITGAMIPVDAGFTTR